MTEAELQALVKAGGEVVMPAGIITLTKPLAITGSIKLRGAGRYATTLVPASGTCGIALNMPVGTFTTILEDFGVVYATRQAAGSPPAIYCNATSAHYDFDARGLLVQNGSWGIQLDKTHFLISNCLIYDNSNGGIVFGNSTNPDSGDSSISECVILNWSYPGTLAVAVQQLSSGGLRLVNNKINSFVQGYQLSLAPGAATGDLIITGNSFEAWGYTNVYTPILLSRQDKTATFGDVVVTGNQFGGWNYRDCNYGGCIEVLYDSERWCTHIVAANNVIL
jgi:hypothetical protein